MNFDIVYADELDKVIMNKNAILVDIRTSEEYERSHWDNAVSMPMDITASSPKWHGTTSSNLFIIYSLLFYSFIIVLLTLFWHNI